MKILARCFDRVIVHLGGRDIAIVKLGKGAEDHAGVLHGWPAYEQTGALECDVDSIAVHGCESCRQNYGPKGSPPEGTGIFQQFALLEGSYPWNNTMGWYCMGCSMPPR